MGIVFESLEDMRKLDQDARYKTARSAGEDYGTWVPAQEEPAGGMYVKLVILESCICKDVGRRGRL